MHNCIKRIIKKYILVRNSPLNERHSECHKAVVSVSECHKAVVSDSEMHNTDNVSEVRLVEQIDDELYEVSEVDYDEVCSIGEADK